MTKLPRASPWYTEISVLCIKIYSSYIFIVCQLCPYCHGLTCLLENNSQLGPPVVVIIITVVVIIIILISTNYHENARGRMGLEMLIYSKSYAHWLASLHSTHIFQGPGSDTKLSSSCGLWMLDLSNIIKGSLIVLMKLNWFWYLIQSLLYPGQGDTCLW